MAVLARVASSSGELKQSRKKAAVEVWEAAFDIVRDRLVLAVETVRDPDRVLESVAHQAIPQLPAADPSADMKRVGALMQRFGELDMYKQQLRALASRTHRQAEEHKLDGETPQSACSGWQRASVGWLMDMEWLCAPPLKCVSEDSDEYATTLTQVTFFFASL